MEINEIFFFLVNGFIVLPLLLSPLSSSSFSLSSRFPPCLSKLASANAKPWPLDVSLSGNNSSIIEHSLSKDDMCGSFIYNIYACPMEQVLKPKVCFILFLLL
jgi:hypothetical protein